MTKAAIMSAFEKHGCTGDDKTAGAVKYTAISIKGSYQRIAAIYGSQGGGASVWVKEDAWTQIRPQVVSAWKEGKLRVDDVDLTKRGFQWSIHFDTPNHPHIETIVKECVNVGHIRWERAQKRIADDARRAEARIIREAKMAERKRDPFA